MSFYSNENIWFYITLAQAGVLIFQVGMWYGSRGETFGQGENLNRSQREAGGVATETSRRAKAESCGLTGVNDEKKTFPEGSDWTNNSPTDAGKKLLGEKDAPLRLVGYFDYQCPFTGRFYTRTLPELRQKYIKPGKLNFQVKHRPLGMHPKAPAVANAAECAADQEKFWQFTDLFLRGDIGAGKSALLKAGRRLKLPDYEKYKSCVEERSHLERVKKENKQAEAKGIGGTPHFRLEEEEISGARPFSDFEEIIEKKLFD